MSFGRAIALGTKAHYPPDNVIQQTSFCQQHWQSLQLAVSASSWPCFSTSPDQLTERICNADAGEGWHIHGSI
jgi:hypothetical protein